MAKAQDEIIIKARVDGPSELIVSTNGFQWKNGVHAKPGRHEGRNEPTYINEIAWIPLWKHQDKDRGIDTSDMLEWPLTSLEMDFELLAIGQTPDASSVEPRTAPTMSYGAGTLIINIPDPEPGSRWYVFALVPVNKDKTP
jgi:hypothetical protein